MLQAIKKREQIAEDNPVMDFSIPSTTVGGVVIFIVLVPTCTPSCSYKIEVHKLA